MRIVFAKPGEPAEVRDIEDKLEAFQSLVDGDIELVTDDKGVAVYCNMDGKYLGLSPNLPIFGGDTLVGNLVFVRVDEDSGHASLSDAESKRIARWLDVQRGLVQTSPRRAN